ncbi:MAG: winged helix-turn-helix domain-containing protein [Candidatus Angelobacter sp.]
MIYEFGSFRLDPEKRILLRTGELINLAPKVFETLVLLVQSNGRILEKDELIQALWPESFVEEGNLSQNIFTLRKFLGDDRNGNAFIQTIPRRGYRFIAAVKSIEATSASLAGQPNEPDYWGRHSPFRSLQTFQPEDAWLFFGRETETQDLLDRLDRSPVLALVGNSGSGKSSLVRAGLIPALHAGRFRQQGVAVRSWRVVVFRPSGAPFDYLAEVLPKQLAPSLNLKEQAEFIAECRSKLPLSVDSLRNAIAALANASAYQAEQTHILLVADQFEEIFTLTSSQQTRNRYIDVLLAAASFDSAVPVHLALSLRADFYANCLEHPQLSRSLQANLYNLPRMPLAKLRESIEKRLHLAGASAETGLIDSLLEDSGSEPGDLALLEHALGLLWEKRESASRTLTNRAYADIGRLRGALGRHADSVYQSVGDEKQKRLTRRIFLELIHLGEGAQDTRRRVPKSHLYSLNSAESVEPLLARLVSSRLVSTGREGDATFVEVSHEALIREWQALREWLGLNREELALERRLRQTAEEWESLGGDTGALLQGARLAQGEEWLARHPEAHLLVQQFVQASIASRAEAQERELARQKELRGQAEARAQAEKQLREQQAAATLGARRSALRLRWLSGALAALLLVAAGSAWIAHLQQLVERSHALSAQSANLLARDHSRALDLALRSWRTAKTEEAELAVARAFPELLATMRHDGPVGHVVFSPDGRLILSVSTDRTAKLWDATDNHLIATLRGHSAEVVYAGFSPDSRQIVTASYDRTARIWNASDGRWLATLSGHTDKVVQAAYSPDGKLIVTASQDHTARIWNSSDGRLLYVLQGHTDKLYGASFSPDGRHIVTTSDDFTARIWSSVDGRLETTFQGHKESVYHAEFFPDSDRVITTSWDRTARIWNRGDGRSLAVLQHSGPVNSARLSPDGQRVITASDDHTARVWRVADGRLLFTLQHDGKVQNAEFSRDGRYIVTASWDHTARVWNNADGRLLALIEGHTDVVDTAIFSPDGHRIVTASADHTLRVWSTATDLMLASLGGDSGPIAHVEFAPHGERIITVSQDETARLWNSSNGALLGPLQNSGGFRQAHFSPDGERIVTAGVDGTAQIWSASNGRLQMTLKGHTDKVEQAAYSPDGQHIVTTSWDHTGRVWNSSDGRLLATLQGHSQTIWYAAFSPDGQRIVTASDDHTARVWNAADGRLLYILQGHTGPVWRAEFSPDGRSIVTASFDHTARLWDSANGRLRATLEGHSDLVDAAQFSPDGQSIVTASWDQTSRVWSSADGHLLAVLQGHTGKVITAVFSPDGRQIVTASRDHTARVWATADYRLVVILAGHTDQVWQAMFSSDGQRIVTASLDQTARVWHVFTLDDIEAILASDSMPYPHL